MQGSNMGKNTHRFRLFGRYNFIVDKRRYKDGVEYNYFMFHLPIKLASMLGVKKGDKAVIYISASERAFLVKVVEKSEVK